MTDQPSPPPDNRTISDLLRDVLAQEDLDSCAIIANAINLYRDALKRRGNNRDLYADDIPNIFNIVCVLLSAAELEQSFKPATRLRGKPEAVK